MSFNLIIILFASWLVSTASVDPAQSSSLGAPGCGPASIKFEVNTDPEQHAVPNPEPEKALVAFLQDDTQFNSTPRPTTQDHLRAAPWILASYTLFAVVVAVASLALWFIGGRSVVEKFVRNRTQPWAVFRVPETTPPLHWLEAKLSGDVVTICNHGNDKWSKVLVQIDAGYLAAIGLLLWGPSLVTSCRGCEPLWGSIHVVGNVDQNLRLVRVASSSALARESHAF